MCWVELQREALSNSDQRVVAGFRDGAEVLMDEVGSSGNNGGTGGGLGAGSGGNRWFRGKGRKWRCRRGGGAARSYDPRRFQRHQHSHCQRHHDRRPGRLNAFNGQRTSSGETGTFSSVAMFQAVCRRHKHQSQSRARRYHIDQSVYHKCFDHHPNDCRFIRSADVAGLLNLSSTTSHPTSTALDNARPMRSQRSYASVLRAKCLIMCSATFI